MPIEPDNKIVPGSPYGELKFFLERMLHWFERIYGLKLRLSALLQRRRRHARSRRGSRPRAAPDPDHPAGRARPARAADDLRRRLPDQGWHLRARLHPCARPGPGAYPGDEALDRLGSRKYNLGNGNGFTNLEVVEAARAITGHPIPYEIGPRRAGDPAILIASSAKIRAELGWQPRYPTARTDHRQRLGMA